MPDSRQEHPIRSAAILLLLGVPSVTATLGGGTGVAMMAGTGGATALEWLAVVGMLLAGIAGMWGSETLRRRPGHRPRAALTGGLIGAAAFVGLVVVVAGGQPDDAERRSRARLRAFEVDELQHHWRHGAFTTDLPVLGRDDAYWRGDPPIVVMEATASRLVARVQGTDCWLVRGPPPPGAEDVRTAVGTSEGIACGRDAAP